MRKRLIAPTIALLALWATDASAQAMLVVTQHDGTSTETELAKVGKLTFSESQLSVYDVATPQTQTYGLANVRTITFKNVATGIYNTTQMAAGDFRLAYANESLAAVGLASAAHARLYTANGVKAMDIKSWDGTPISVHTLPAGVYIFKVNNKTIKFVKK